MKREIDCKNTTPEEDALIDQAASLGLDSLIKIIERLDDTVTGLNEVIDSLTNELDEAREAAGI